MKLTAIYKGHSEVVEGVSQNGNAWRRVTAVFETPGDRPNTIAFSAFNAAVEGVLNLTVGNIYDVSFDLNSRSYTDKNGIEKCFTDAKAWAFQPAEQPQQAPAQTRPAPQPKQSNMFEFNGNGEDDPPF